MTSKSLFFNLMKEDNKRRLWASALTFLVLFFSIPVVIALVLSNFEWSDSDTYMTALREVKGLLNYSNGWLAFLMIILSLIMGVTSFSYLHSRQKVDFYHGLPVRREKLFFVNYLNGILIPALCYAVNILLGVIIAAAYGLSLSSVLSSAFGGFVFFLVHYAMLYSVTVLAMIMTGNIVVGILGTGVLHFYFPALLGIILLCSSTFFQTSYRGGLGIIEKLFDKCSALVLFIFNIGYFSDQFSADHRILRLVIVVIVTCVIAGLALLLYKKRGSEAAGRAMAFKISKPVIQIPIVILSSLSGSLFFWHMQSGMGWAVFGLICGMFLSHCVLEIIYHFDFKKLLTHKVQMIVCAAVAAVIFCGFRYDLFGYDRYIPAQDSIESIAVSFSNMNYWVSYGWVEGERPEDYNWYYQDNDEYQFEHMELTNIEPVLSLIEAAVEKNQEIYHEAGQRVKWNDDGYYYYFSVKYNLKNGKEVLRTYRFSSAEERQEVLDIYSDQDFIRSIYPVLTQTPEETASVHVKQGEQSKLVTRRIKKL